MKKTLSLVLLLLSSTYGLAQATKSIGYVSSAKPFDLAWNSSTGPSRYISPTGNDGNDGTWSDDAHAWKTFSHAIPLLAAGYTLWLTDGLYTLGTTGLPDIDCSAGAVTGTANAPITIRAINERAAHLQSDGSKAAIRIRNCGYYNVIGLWGSSTDNLGGTDNSVFDAGVGSGPPNTTHHLVFRRNLGQLTNRYFNCHVFEIWHVDDALFEENEAYDFHRHGMGALQSNRVVFRRNYVNARPSQGHAGDISGGCGGGAPPNCSHTGADTMGDEGITHYWSPDGIIENCITEYTEGIQSSSQRAIIVGNASINAIYGFRSVSNCNDGAECDSGWPTKYAWNNRFENNVAILDATYGKRTMDLYGSGAGYVNGMTSVINGVGGGVVLQNYSSSLLYIGSYEGHNMANMGSSPSSNGFLITPSPVSNCPTSLCWKTFYTNGDIRVGADYSPATSDATGLWINKTETAVTNMGVGANQCIMWVPATSNMKGAGENGGDLGATVLYRYEHGHLTSQHLWDADGNFPCGTIVSGVNDIAGVSCFDVKTRLNVNYNSCTPTYN